MTRPSRVVCSVGLLIVLGGPSDALGSDGAPRSTNSIGMTLLSIEPGTFSMGALNPTPGGLDPSPPANFGQAVSD